MGLVCTGMIWGHAQSPPEIRPLHIGDTVPDITLNHIINYKTTSAKLSDFRGKLLILDFWATWCGACIGSFPRTHRLQVEFNNQVQFLPVAYESPETSRKMLDRIQKNEGITIPSVTSDTILIKLFPHRVLPHYVWIGKSGHVIAITGLEDLTYSNISKFLSDQAPVLPVKTDYQIPFNRNRPLFLDGNGGNGSQTVYRSVISRYVPGIDGCSGSGIKSMNSIHGRRIYAVNTTIVNLYRMALGKSYTKFLPRSRVILDVKDTDRVITGLSGRKYIEWLQRNGYCYELQVPPALMHKAFDIMAQELNRYFKAMLGISARMEKRTVPCYVLIRTTKDNKVLTKGGKSIHQVSAYNLKILTPDTRVTTLWEKVTPPL